MDFLTLLHSLSTGDLALIVFALLSIIQISPIKIDPWSWLLRWFGKSINGEVEKKIGTINEHIKDVDTRLDDMMNLGEQKDADAARNRILIFDDELRRHIDHSYEYFQQILADVDEYTRFCDEHESYPNSKAEMAIKHIKDVYDKCKEQDNFI